MELSDASRAAEVTSFVPTLAQNASIVRRVGMQSPATVEVERVSFFRSRRKASACLPNTPSSAYCSQWRPDCRCATAAHDSHPTVRGNGVEPAAQANDSLCESANWVADACSQPRTTACGNDSGKTSQLGRLSPPVPFKMVDVLLGTCVSERFTSCICSAGTYSTADRSADSGKNIGGGGDLRSGMMFC